MPGGANRQLSVAQWLTRLLTNCAASIRARFARIRAHSRESAGEISHSISRRRAPVGTESLSARIRR
jgi:hypothetical protein